MKIGDYVLIIRRRVVFEALRTTSKIVSETKTLWKCEDGTRICKCRPYNRKDIDTDSNYLYGKDFDHAMVITKEQKDRIEHEQWVNRKFKKCYESLEYNDRNNNLSTKTKEEIIKMIDKQFHFIFKKKEL